MEIDAIVAEARRLVAGGHEPDWTALEERVREASGDAPARERALAQLGRLAGVQRARSRVAVEPTRPAAPVAQRRGRVAPRPTLSGTIDVQRERAGDAHVLRWPADPAVVSWDVRIGERADVRSAYVDRETVTLPGETTSLELPLGGGALRIHVLGRGRGGRLLRRVLVTGLTRENWDARWQRRPTAT